MLSKLKVLAPFALIAMTLTSCGNNSNNLKSRIKRIEYQEIKGVDIADQVHSVLNSIYGKQTEADFYDAHRLKLLNEGSINTTFEIALKGLISHNELHMNSFNIASKSNYQVAWNVDKQYAEFKGDGKSSYVVNDGDYPYYAYSYFVDGKEVKERVPIIETNFSDYLRGCLASRGLFFANIDLGLSGLGYNPRDYKYDSEKAMSIGGAFHGKNLYKAYDYLNENAGKGHNLTYKVATNGEGTFSGNLTAHLNLKTLKDNVEKSIPEEFREYIESMLSNSAISGNLDFDLFAAWDKNFICQQEYMVNASNIDIAKSSHSNFERIKATGNIYFGEEVTQQFDVTDEAIQQILTDYKVL